MQKSGYLKIKDVHFSSLQLTSYIGSLSEFHCATRSLLKSTTVTFISEHFKAMTLQVGPPTYPAPKQQIFLITILYSCNKKSCIKLKNGEE